ncbi:MAG: superoxide dismutase [Phenylobacterium sp.]
MITLPDLPYAYDALEPVLSAETLHVHHDKHHAKYVETTNQLAAEKSLTGKTLEEIIIEAQRQGWTKLFNNAAQAWNHTFFWLCMTPGPLAPSAAFGKLRDDFVKQGAEHFGSGWAWLEADGQEIKVLVTHDAADLLGRPQTPLIVCDLWEHAYYLDHKNDRKAFLEGWWDQIANWSFAEQQLTAARSHGQRWVSGMAA